VTSRFGVQRISSDVVELVDAVDASAFRLVLKCAPACPPSPSSLIPFRRRPRAR
jgi:hypothetical protein